MRLNLYDNVVTNYKDKDGARGWKAVSDVLRMAKDLEYLDLSACMLESDGCAGIIAALMISQQTYPKLQTRR
jgi:hypothetical protein